MKGAKSLGLAWAIQAVFPPPQPPTHPCKPSPPHKRNKAGRGFIVAVLLAFPGLWAPKRGRKILRHLLGLSSRIYL